MPMGAEDVQETAWGERRPGPLSGLRVVEFLGIGPGPHCAMMLADLGAQVVRVQREGGNGWPNPVADRGRAVLVADLRSPDGRERCLQALDHADVLIEGFRPGVMERLGLGPDIVLTRVPRLVYGRMTGWGQDGPLAKTAGHDLNYIALTGALAAMGRSGQPPTPPLNLVGDFGGGSMFLLVGILAALLERDRSGIGQVVDAAIIDGVASLMSTNTGFVANGLMSIDRENGLLNGSAPFYRCYVCADGKEVAVGAIEPHFYRELISRIGAPPAFVDDQYDVGTWPQRSRDLEFLLKGRTAEEWCKIFEGSDACLAPVLDFAEAQRHPQLAGRQSYVAIDGVEQPSPAPRFSRTPADIAVERSSGADMVARWATIRSHFRSSAQGQE